MRNKDRIKIVMGDRTFRSYQPVGFYVQRMTKSGHCGGYLTDRGGWAKDFNIAQVFKTRDEAIAAFHSSNTLNAWICKNEGGEKYSSELKAKAVKAIDSGRLPHTGAKVLARIEAVESVRHITHCQNCGHDLLSQT